MTTAAAPVSAPAPTRSGGRRSWWLPVLLALVAFGVRLVPVLRGGGLWAQGNYDDAVNFTVAVGLAHGLLPYRDFLFLHPPGIALALLPFAAAGRIVGDPDAFAAARVAFMAVGAVNAVLIRRALRPQGRPAALVGGLFYAVFAPAAYVEHSTLLEGPATTCTLLAVLLLSRTTCVRRTPTSVLLLAGGLLGVSAGIKIWGVVLALTLVGWTLLTRGRRAAGLVTGGVGVGATVVCLPFYLAAPDRMWHEVVLDQLGRRQNPAEVKRVVDVLGLHGLTPLGTVHAPVVVAGVVVLLCALTALRSGLGRLAVLTLVATMTLLLNTPSWFLHYAGLSAAPLALVVGSAVGVLGNRAGRRGFGVVTLAFVAGLALLAVPAVTGRFGHPFPGQRLGVALAGTPGCVTTDEPTSLLEADVLNRNLDRGCPLMADLGGYTYALQPTAGPELTRRADAAWQEYALRYLASGTATVVLRFGPGVGFVPASAAAVRRWPVVRRVEGFEVRDPHQPVAAAAPR